MNLEGLSKEEIIEIKKALNELYANRVTYIPPNEILKESNDKYTQMDLNLIQKIVNILEESEQC